MASVKLTTVVALLMEISCMFIKTCRTDQACIPRFYGMDSVVCVCNATYCDTILQTRPLPSIKYALYTSNQAGARFKKQTFLFTSALDDANVKNAVTIDFNTTYQTIIGWGATFTDASGSNIHSLDEGAKENLLRSYFSKQGIEYNLGRVLMGGSDFSTHPYSYDDGEEDVELANFKLSPEDYKYKIPILKNSNKLSNGSLWLLASASFAPKWMIGNLYDGTYFLRPPMYQVWVNYFLKFLQSYWERWIDFWGVTTGSQPSSSAGSTVHTNSVYWLPEQMRFWISNYLGPTLRNSSFSFLKLLVFDDDIPFLSTYVDKLFLSAKVKGYVDGIAVHSNPRTKFSVYSLSVAHKHFPDKAILNTMVAPDSLLLGAWQGADYCANDIITNLDNWVTGWMEANLALDMAGGPTFVRRADAPIIVNGAADEFYKQPAFYAIGHFSKFIPRGSIRVAISNHYRELKIIAFKRPDTGVAIVILNRKLRPVSVVLTDKRRGNINVTAEPKSLTTILYW